MSSEYTPSFHGKGKYFIPYLLIEILLAEIGYPMTASELVSIAKRGEYEPRKINLLDMLELFEATGRQASGYQLDPSDMRAAGLPLLAQFNDDDGPTFVVLVNRGPAIRAFHPRVGWLSTPECELLSRCTGFVISPRKERRSPDDLQSAFRTDEEDKEFLKSSILVFDNFVTSEQCALIEAMAGSKWERSRVGTYYETGNISRQRTSDTAMLGKDDHDKVVLEVLGNLQRVIPGCTESDVEMLQCVRYQKTQEFRPHLDISFESPPDSRRRWWTVLVYLNDTFSGGETYFPLIDCKIIPQRGRALIFPNRRANGDPLIPSLHTGLPVTLGEKRACNIWIEKPSGKTGQAYKHDQSEANENVGDTANV